VIQGLLLAGSGTPRLSIPAKNLFRYSGKSGRTGGADAKGPFRPEMELIDLSSLEWNCDRLQALNGF